MPKIGVILSGCGVYDGSEIHEAVLTLLCLDARGVEVQCMAPRKPLQVVDHLTQQPVAGETRCVLAESARIARGDVLDLKEVQAADYDAFILPGGFGAAKNLCTFAVDGPDCSVDPEVERVLQEAQAAGKPLGFACIAPAVAAKVFGDRQVKVTIGHDPGTAAALEKLGAQHQECNVDQAFADDSLQIVTTPAYMEAHSISEAHAGIDKMVAQVLRWVAAPAVA